MGEQRTKNLVLGYEFLLQNIYEFLLGHQKYSILSFYMSSLEVLILLCQRCVLENA